MKARMRRTLFNLVSVECLPGTANARLAERCCMWLLLRKDEPALTEMATLLYIFPTAACMVAAYVRRWLGLT